MESEQTSSESRLIWIAGATRGIGRALADRLEGESGYRVLRLGRSLGLDVFDEDRLLALLAQEGTPFGLVHCIGDFEEAALLSTSPAAWQRLLTSNVESFLTVVRVLAPAMAEKGEGRILAFGAAGLDRGKLRAPAYFACKAALRSLVSSLARELGSRGIAVNLVSPGLIRHADSATELEARLERSVPLGRSGTLSDLLPLLEFLLGDRASYLTGQNFVVDGGLSL